jgi:hypothetical protein
VSLRFKKLRASRPFAWVCFSLNPFADIFRAIRELDAFRFTTSQKTHYVAIHEFRVDDFGAPRYPEVVLVVKRSTLLVAFGH